MHCMQLEVANERVIRGVLAYAADPANARSTEDAAVNIVTTTSALAEGRMFPSLSFDGVLTQRE